MRTLQVAFKCVSLSNSQRLQHAKLRRFRGRSRQPLPSENVHTYAVPYAVRASQAPLPSDLLPSHHARPLTTVQAERATSSFQHATWHETGIAKCHPHILLVPRGTHFSALGDSQGIKSKSIHAPVSGPHGYRTCVEAGESERVCS